MFILVVVLIALAVLVVVVSMQPDEFTVSRSATVMTGPEKVFPEVNDFHKWEAWSPWAKLDPTAKTTFEGPAEGVGAVMRWDGNAKVGTGSATITESRPNEKVAMRLDFLKPFQASNTAAFTFRAEGNQTLVTWSMAGKNTFMSKAMGLIMNCEKMIGEQFDKGLASLKAVAESKR